VIKLVIHLTPCRKQPYRLAADQPNQERYNIVGSLRLCIYCAAPVIEALTSLSSRTHIFVHSSASESALPMMVLVSQAGSNVVTQAAAHYPYSLICIFRGK